MFRSVLSLPYLLALYYDRPVTGQGAGFLRLVCICGGVLGEGLIRVWALVKSDLWE